MYKSGIQPAKADSESPNAFTIIKLSTDQVAVQRACQLIDIYVQEASQPPGSRFNPAELKWPLLN